jgi:hypothetical protein
MDVTLASLLNLYVFSTGRRIFAVQHVGKAAAAAGLTAIATHCEKAVGHDQTTRDLEARWAGDRTASQFSPEARPIDTLVDIALGALRDAIDAEARDADPGDDLAEAAAKLEKEAFPNGVAAITTLGYVDELNQVQRIIALLQSATWSALVPKLGLDRRLSRLVDLEQKYGAVLAEPAKTISFGEVKEARHKGQSLMLQAVAMILGQYPSESDADIAGRQALLKPILDQNDAIRVYLRERRAVEDVNPTTGQVEPAAPAAGAPVGQPATPPAAPPAAGPPV